MAKIEISVDTEKRTVKATIDGKKFSNLSDAHIFSEEGGFFAIDLSQVEVLDDSTRKVTRVVANKDREGSVASEEYPGLYEEKVEPFTAAQLSIALFGRDRT